jgi:hypothetical protein
MSDFRNPHIELVPPESNLVFNSLGNYWFLVDKELPLNTVNDSYSDYGSDFLFVDCSRSFPRKSNYGFIKDLIDFILNSKHFVVNTINSTSVNIIKELDELGNDDFKIKKMIFSFFEDIIVDTRQLIVLLFRDLHILTEEIEDKEIVILREILISINKIRFWCFSDEKAETNRGRLKSKFLQLFTFASDNQLQTFITCLKCDPNVLLKQIKTKQLIKMEKVKLFISYAHADESFKEELKKHLSGLKRNGLVEEWHDRYIKPGELWDEEIKRNLNEAQIILFLISSDFMASDYINDVEIGNALSRYSRGEVIIIPIIIRSCDFSSLQVSSFQALPKDAKPITKWDDRDEAWLNVINGIKSVLQMTPKKDLKNDIIGNPMNTPDSPSKIDQGGQNNINIGNNSGIINFSK